MTECIAHIRTEDCTLTSRPTETAKRSDNEMEIVQLYHRQTFDASRIQTQSFTA